MISIRSLGGSGRIAASLALLAAMSGCLDLGGTTPEPLHGAAQLHVFGGNGQRGVVDAELPQRLVVQALDGTNTPIVGQPIAFTGNGQVGGEVVTDRQGRASAAWRLGTRAGPQKTVAQFDIRGRIARAEFHAEALPGPAAAVQVLSDEASVALPGTRLDPALVRTTDAFGNTVPGIRLSWEVTAGDGSLEELDLVSNAGGGARGTWRLGSTAGAHAMRVSIENGSMPRPQAELVATATAPFKVQDVHAGRDHTCARTADRITWCWGSTVSGQIGDGVATVQPRKWPARVATSLGFSTLAVGDLHTCGLASTTGQPWCWGFTYGTSPSTVLGSPTFISITGGFRHTCALTASGEAYCWGNNEVGQLGNGGQSTVLPSRVVGSGRFVALAAIGDHTCGLSDEGSAWCWGQNDDDQLGAETHETCTIDGGFYYQDMDVPCATSPVRVTVQQRAVALWAGPRGACVRTTEPALRCWGHGSPAAVEVNGGAQLTHLALGDTWRCGLDPGGAVLCWLAAEWMPVPRPLATPVRFASLSGRGESFCGVSRDGPGTAWCWGQNMQGNVGDGTSAFRALPVPVAAPPGR